MLEFGGLPKRLEEDAALDIGALIAKKIEVISFLVVFKIAINFVLL